MRDSHDILIFPKELTEHRENVRQQKERLYRDMRTPVISLYNRDRVNSKLTSTETALYMLCGDIIDNRPRQELYESVLSVLGNLVDDDIAEALKNSRIIETFEN